MLKQNACRLALEGCRAKLAVTAAGLVAFLALVVAAGAHPLQGVLVWGGAFLYLYLPGEAYARLFGFVPAKGEWPVLQRLLFGCGGFAVLTCVAARLGWVWLLRLLPPVVGLLWPAAALWQAKKQGRRPERPHPAWRDGAVCTLAAVWGILCVLFALAISVPAARPSAVGVALSPSQDLLWNVGNAKSFALGFPPQDIRFAGVRFSYHYLTELLWGGLSMATGVDAYDLMVFWAGPLVLFALLFALWSLGLFFYRGSRGRTLGFLALLLGCGCVSGVFAFGHHGLGLFGNSSFLHLVTNINAQATAVVFLCAFFILFGQAARAGFHVSWRHLGAICCSFLLCCFAKGPMAAIVVCSFAVTMALVLLFQKPHYLKALCCAGGVAAIFAVVYTAVFSAGAGSSMTFGVKTIQDCYAFGKLAGLSDKLHLSYLGLVLICLVQWFLMQPVQFILFFTGLPKDARRFWALPAERLLANGAAVGGMLAYFLFWHPSYSQVYFALLAFLFTSLLGVDAAARLRRPPVQKVLGALAVWCALSTGAMALSVAADALPVLQGVQSASASACVTVADEEAMGWLAANTPKTATFATNRIHTYPDAGNGISNLYTALSGRQAYLEGYTYALTNMGVSQPVLDGKLAVNGSLFSAATAPAQRLALCAENGVDYLVYCDAFAGDAPEGLTCVWQKDGVSIWQAG